MPTKNQAEQSLSDLSMTELGDRLPALLPYLLGFELINSNDEKTRAAGILGFDIGGERILIPCLFLNGRIRGMEMMYLSDTDTFVSATPQWVEYLTSRSTGVTGAPDPAGDRTGTVPSAALRIFNREPQITKRAGLDMFEKFIDLDKALSDSSSTFISVLKSMGKKAYLDFMTDITENHPELFGKIAEYYDITELEKIAQSAPLPDELKNPNRGFYKDEIIHPKSHSNSVNPEEPGLPGDPSFAAQAAQEQARQQAEAGVAGVQAPTPVPAPSPVAPEPLKHVDTPEESYAKNQEARKGMSEKIVPEGKFNDQTPGTLFGIPADQIAPAPMPEHGSLRAPTLPSPTPAVKDITPAPIKPIGTPGVSSLSAPKLASLEFITLNQIESNPSAFDNETKMAVMRDGMVVLDKRAADEKSELFTDNYGRSFRTPCDTSFYSIINVYGNMKEVLIAHYPFNPMHPNKNSNRNIIIDTESGVIRTGREIEDLLARHRKDDAKEQFDAFHGKLPNISSVKIGKTYMLVASDDANRLMSIPFKVENRVVEDGKTSISISVDSWKYGLDLCSGVSGLSSGPGHRHTLLITDSDGEKTHAFGATVAVSKDWRVLEINDGPEYSDADYKTKKQKYENECDQLRPAGQSLIAEVIQGKGILELNVHKKQGRYIIRNQGLTSRPHTKLGALQILTAYIGIDATAAQSLLDEVQEGNHSTNWVKRAAIYNGMDFPDTDQNQGVNELGINEQAPFYQSQQVPLNNPPVPDDWNLDAGNYDKIKKNDVDFLMRAADTNSKAVFDPAMIGVLLKSNRTQLQIDQWVPDLVGALDKLCRLLLLFYWKNADFSESYGNDDMAELEDVLLNNVKNLGTVVLFLKQHAAESSTTKIDAFSGN